MSNGLERHSMRVFPLMVGVAFLAFAGTALLADSGLGLPAGAVAATSLIGFGTLMLALTVRRIMGRPVSEEPTVAAPR